MVINKFKSLSKLRHENIEKKKVLSAAWFTVTERQSKSKPQTKHSRAEKNKLSSAIVSITFETHQAFVDARIKTHGYVTSPRVESK